MTHYLQSVLYVSTFACTLLLTSCAANTAIQNSKASTDAVPTANAAYIYVSSTPTNGGVNQIEAYAAGPDGRLTAVSGSPFQEDVTAMASNGKQLFAVSSNGFDLESYSINSDGSLSLESTTNASQSGNCNTVGSLFLDRTGTTLYGMEFRGSGCANNTYESFAIGQPAGLSDLGNSSANNWLSLPASFIGNNTYAYTASCLSDMYWGIYGFQRGANGSIAQININAKPPTAPSGYFYCPSQAVADSSDDVAIAMQPVQQQSFSANLPAQLATYTADTSGSLTTESTAANMPATSVGTVADLKISPSGALLAVGGSAGLQIFHFNGSGPITQYTGLLTGDSISQFFWDNGNHLYAISRSAGKLYVFTVTPASYSQAPGSPYVITQPGSLVVQAQ